MTKNIKINTNMYENFIGALFENEDDQMELTLLK